MMVVIQFVLSGLLVISDAATNRQKVPATTASDCGSQDCSGFQILTGPWGVDNQTQYVQMICEVDVTESKHPGDLSVLLSLDRDIVEVTPHTLQLVAVLPGGLQFTFTNTYIVPISTFQFDFELSYSIDQGNAAIPGGNCSGGGAIIVTTIQTTSTAAFSTPTSTTTPTTKPTPTTITSPATTTSLTTLSTTTTSHLTTTTSSTAVASTTRTPASRFVTTSSFTPNVQTSTPQSSSNSENKDEGNIFSRICDGYVYSIILVAALTLGFIIFLAVLACCIYKCAIRKRVLNRVKDETDNNTETSKNSSSSARSQHVARQTSGSHFFSHPGRETRTQVHNIGKPTLDFV